MTLLNKSVSDMTLTELQNLIRSEIARLVPPMPAGVAALADHNVPLIKPPAASDGQVLTYDQATDSWIPV